MHRLKSRPWSLLALLLAASSCGSSSGSDSPSATGTTSTVTNGGTQTAGTQNAATSSSTDAGGTASSIGGAGGSGSGGTPDAGGTGSGGTLTSDTGGGTGGGTGGSTSGGAGATSTGGTGGGTSTGGSGEGTPEVCTFSISDSLSSVIPTVGIVDWSMDLEDVTEARIDFDLIDPEPGELNVGSGGPILAADSEAWLLGMKPERDYAYRITVTAGETVCVSRDQFLTTGALADAPPMTRAAGPAADSQEVGFILNCGYGTGQAMIIDADGEIVWAVPSLPGCTRAHMDWDGQYMWLMSANATTGETAGGNDGQVVRLRMDGSAREEIPGLERAHHDFAVLPGGVTAFLVVVDEPDTGIVERAPDGTLTTIVVLNEDSYLEDGTATHPNALRYYERVNGYTVGDLDVASVIQFSREGTAEWQVGGYCSEPPEECDSMNLTGVHGHQWLENGNLIAFLAGIGTSNTNAPDPVVEYRFEGTMESANAHLEWFYRDTERSFILGDVERLSNGNTLITYSNTGVIQEVTPAKELVQTLTGSDFGYSSFRRVLYGPPQ